jgi:selenide,water dikinase
MARGSRVNITIYRDKVPFLPRVRELAELGAVPGGTKNNYAHVEPHVVFPDHLDQIDRWMLCDAVTSGGLLISVEAGQADRLLSAFLSAGVEAAMIGEVTGPGEGRIRVV